MEKLQYAIIIVLVVVVAALAVAIAVIKPGTGDHPGDDATSAPDINSDNVLSSGSPTENGSLSPDITDAPIGSSPATLSPDNTVSPVDPSKPLSGIVICIDPGHQGEGNREKEPCAPWGKDANASVNNEVMKTKCASGTTGKFTNVPEYIVTLEISLKMKTSLEALGAKVVMIREDHNVNISNKERAEIGNNANADVVLRVHCNGAESESAKGIELYVRDKGDNTAAYKERSDYDYSVASELMDYLISATGAKNRGVKRSDNYTGTNWSSVPSVIIECGFMSNEEEDNLLVTEAYQQKFADAVAEWLKNSEIIKK